MSSRVQGVVLLGTIVALAACTATNSPTSAPPRDRAETVARLPLGHNAGEDPALFIPHGAETAGGRVRMISAGNLHIMVGPEATVTRTAQGVVVVSHGRTRSFPADATITEGGSYHTYAALRK